MPSQASFSTDTSSYAQGMNTLCEEQELDRLIQLSQHPSKQALAPFRGGG